MTDYRPLSVNDRIKTALSEALAAGVDLLKARSLIALSLSEAGGIWTEKRATGGPLAQAGWDDCWPTRVVVGLETRVGTFGKRFDSNWASDPEAAAKLESTGLGILKSDGMYYPSLPAVDSDAFAQLFEWVMGRRKALLLADFSIGPTQMYMLYSGPSVDAGAGPKTMNFSWPPDWQGIADLYSMPDAGALMNRIIYLDPANNPFSKVWPAANPSDSDNAIQWLRNQVGTDVDIATTYYNNHYGPNLNKVISLT